MSGVAADGTKFEVEGDTITVFKKDSSGKVIGNNFSGELCPTNLDILPSQEVQGKKTKLLFSCEKNAPFPLAGAKYTGATNLTNSCPGFSLTCVAGCSPKVPQVLKGIYYECEGVPAFQCINGDGIHQTKCSFALGEKYRTYSEEKRKLFCKQTIAGQLGDCIVKSEIGLISNCHLKRDSDEFYTENYYWKGNESERKKACEERGGEYTTGWEQ